MSQPLDAAQSGDELCLNCKRIWKYHKGANNDCPDGMKKFEPSGRIEQPPAAREEHHHHPAFIPPQRRCERCHGDHPTIRCDRLRA
jgi:hypothetical protein